MRHRLLIRVVCAMSLAAVALSTVALPAAAASPSSSPTEITQLGSRVFFAATTASHGRELWISDGTSAGTHEFKDINPSGDSSPSSLTVVGSRLFFNAFDGSIEKLWVSDGTLVGTVPLSDGFAYELVNVGGTLFFLRGTTVWKSNGTVAGTDPVETVPGDAVATGYDGWRSAAAYQGEYYFFVDPVANGIEPWKLWSSNGTPAGTNAIDELAAHREPTEMVVSGNLLYFNLLSGGIGGTNPGDLWRSDGTATGTRQVKDLYPPPDPKDPIDADGVGDLENVAGTLFFSVSNTEVWKSNGTAAGTKRLKLFDTIGHKMVLSRLTNRLMFSVEPFGDENLQLWRSKGTNASTVMINDAGPYQCSESAAPDPECVPFNYRPVVAGNLLFYPAETAAQGIELWVTDGTAAGTHLVRNVRSGTNSSRPSDLARLGSTLLFVANNGNSGRELWKSDGTAVGTKLVKDINPG